VTRLRAGDLTGIAAGLSRYDEELRARTGRGLFGLACRAAGVPERRARRRVEGALAAVVPMDSGQGLIPGFADAVRAVLAHLGCRAYVTPEADVAGLADAYENASDLIVAADDLRFIALSTRTRRVVDNAGATGRGFVAGLELMAGGLARRQVLVLGCGQVGAAAASALLGRGAVVSLFDPSPGRAARLIEATPGPLRGRLSLEPEIPGAIRRHRLIVEATPAAGTITEELVDEHTRVAAPGVPLGVTPEAARKLDGRLLHDPLQIGVATMLMEALGS